jgi:hypothetical protein
MNDRSGESRESYEFEFWQDPLTKTNHFYFGNELHAIAPNGARLDWKIQIPVLQPRGSTLVVGAGLAAMTQRDLYGDRIGAFDIGSALEQILQRNTTIQQIARAGARLDLACLDLMAEVERARYRP